MTGTLNDRAGPPLHYERHYVIGDATSVGVDRTARARVWSERDQLRLFPLIERWHRLGPRSAFELLDVLVGDDPFLADDVEHLLERYARLDPEHVAALDGRELQLPLVMVEGGRR